MIYTPIIVMLALMYAFLTRIDWNRFGAGYASIALGILFVGALSAAAWLIPTALELLGPKTEGRPSVRPMRPAYV